MPTAKEELKRLCTEINSGKLATVTVFWERTFSKEDGATAEGYVIDEVKPPKIFLQKKNLSYRDILLTLFHELGHVFDKKRYPHCKRLKICDKYYFTDKEFEKAKVYLKYIKFAFLHTEYIAEKYIPTLIKRFKLNLNKPFTKTDIDICNMSTLKIKKYQILYGKDPSRQLKRLWNKQLKKNPKELTLDYIKDLDNL